MLMTRIGVKNIKTVGTILGSVLLLATQMAFSKHTSSVANPAPAQIPMPQGRGMPKILPVAPSAIPGRGAILLRPNHPVAPNIHQSGWKNY